MAIAINPTFDSIFNFVTPFSLSQQDDNNMAAATVFNTVELLETILANLPTKDLLLSQRVSTTFRNTIQGSIHLRRALYLSPGQPDDVGETLHSFGQYRYRDTASGIAAKVVFNPLLVADVGPEVRHTRLRRAPLLSDLPRLSCDRMYLTHPPKKLKAIIILVGFKSRPDRYLDPANATRVCIDDLEGSETFGQLRALCRVKTEEKLRQEGRKYDVAILAESSKFHFNFW